MHQAGHVEDQVEGGGDVNGAPSRVGWSFGRSAEGDWMPWGKGGARAKVLAGADGYVVALVEAEEGYRATPHEHAFTEFLYVLEGALRCQGVVLEAGDGFAAAAGSTHDDFEAVQPARYLHVFKI